MIPTLSGPMLAPASGAAPRHLVVLLHGYGSNGDDLISLAPAWRPVLPDALFLSPNAHEPVPGYPSGYQWFAPAMSGDRIAARQVGLQAAAPVLVHFLEDLWSQTGLGAGDTILAGFSQGAMMALHVGLALPEPLLGVIAFSGSFFAADNFGTTDLPRPPVCIVHGDMDQMVGPELGAAANAALIAADYDVRYHVSRGVGHGIAPDGLSFATDFIASLAGRP
ncbi:alpha/beta hydrolase [uncultured Devosia sp.]|uniref:alpha/beta hydrolase n=1 Tax=uncultured Devosia sp. TaxID=211434 RepID=UPI0035CA53C5